ncbi:MAG: UDP-N-acetylmuramoyl-tripeptide--D-alanyl-D-alanine ligase [Candidatus Liptonbacteria bacterium]|nr:UDP-N-acetylmuramoyl-tripeptide--D-alanyl-D-alanine ligase [Candidatus Liptonbacteria bacterium]
MVKRLAQLAVWRYRPGIIGITGSVGKTSTKLAVQAVLGGERRVRASAGNLNSDLGLPLTILGDWSEKELALVSRDQPPHTARIRKLFFWAKVILSSFWRVLFAARSSYPDILVLEYGADRPGDLKYLLGIARPNISVITAIGDIPVHVEFFAGPDDVAREKARLIEYLPSAGFAVLNRDDDSVMNLKDRTRAHVITFGFASDADVRISRFENRTEGDVPAGISFKLEYGGSLVPVRLDGVFGKAQSYASAAAAAIGLVFGLNLVKISEALKKYVPADSRMKLVPGIKHTHLIDDSYNASPLSMHAALDTLKSLPAKRKMAVLGDMLEIGKYAIEAHERAGRLAGKFLDVLITVGPRAKFIAEEARKSGMRRNKIYSFDTADAAKREVQNLMKKGDLVLIKGSHAMELNKVVEEVKQYLVSSI